MKQAVKIAVLGCGTVGAQVVRLLQERAADYQARCGASLEIIGICVHNLAAPRPDFISRDLLTDQAEPLIDQADLVIELIGGIEPARTYITRALEAGKSARNCLTFPASGKPTFTTRPQSLEPSRWFTACANP